MMDKRKNKHRVQPDKEYKLTFGVNQTRKISEAANAVNETPQTFLKIAASEKAKAVTGE